MPSRELQTFKAAYFRALGHPIRIHILKILVRGDRTVQELQEALGLDQPIVSQQLAVLRNHESWSPRSTGRRCGTGSTRGMLRELKRESRRS
jgi:ArsR family transcriptional regulator